MVLRFVLYLRLDKTVYISIHNILVPVGEETTQIDHVLVSRFGIFVIETKNIKGWIFGAASSDRWCQSVFGKKFFFQNPLRQNYRHTRALAEFLKIDHEVFHSIVVFVGDCKFRTPMPENVMQSGLIRYISRFTQVVFTDPEVQEIEGKLRTWKATATISNRQHCSSLKARHSTVTTCPKCGSALVARVAKRGKWTGQSFFGCSRYPKCRYTKT